MSEFSIFSFTLEWDRHYIPSFFGRRLTERINAVVNCTPIRVNNEDKFINLMI